MFPPAALWRTLPLVAPGRSPRSRLRDAVALPSRVRADRSHAAAVDLLGGGAPHLAVFGDRLFDPVGDSASHRLSWLMRLAARDGYEVSFYGVRERRWLRIDDDLRVAAAAAPREATVAWVVRPEAGAALVPALAARPQLRVVYDTMDLHYLRLERESEITGSRGLSLQARLMRMLEQQLAEAADVAVAITEPERQLLRGLAPAAKVEVLPNVHAPRHDVPPTLASRSGVLFVGDYTHTPNVDAAHVLVRELMPRLWVERPELVLRLAGRGLDTALLAPLDPRVEVLGFVDDLDELVDRSLLLVAPLRFGAGLKGKIGYALARGLPVVTTGVGAEGFAEPAGMVIAAAGAWDEFAARALELLRQDALWNETSAAGIDLTRREYAPDVLAGRLRSILEPDEDQALLTGR